ncbi:hypothetical protein IFVP408_C1230204 [Vibrio parahaemolyticus]
MSPTSYQAAPPRVRLAEHYTRKQVIYKFVNTWCRERDSNPHT